MTLPAAGAEQSPAIIDSCPEWLAPYGEAGRLLAPYAERLVVLPQGYVDRFLACLKPESSEDEFHSLIAGLPRPSESPTADIGARLLTEHLRAIADTLCANPSLVRENRINWGLTGLSLLSRAEENPGTEAASRLSGSALIASLFDEDPAGRLTFIQTVHDTGLVADMQRAGIRLSARRLAIILGGYRDISPGVRYDRDQAAHFQHEYSVRGFDDFMRAFVQPREIVDEYTQLVLHRPEKPAEDPHCLLHNMAGQCVVSASARPDAAHSAVEASIAAPGVDRWVFDPHKVERVAMQKHYLDEVAAAVFPDGSDQELRQRLAALRHQWQHPRTAGQYEAAMLLHNMRDAVKQQAAQVEARYKLFGDPPEESLTADQRTALRYRRLTERSYAFRHLMRYIDPSVSEATVTSGSKLIYSTSAKLAQLPEHVGRYIASIAKAAKADPSLGASPEELRDLAHAHTLQLKKRAGGTLNDDSATVAAGTERHGNRELCRDKTGVLRLKGNIIPPIIRAHVQAGVRLACVALQVKVRTDNAEAPETTSKRKPVDLITALARVMIDEAYERGAFSPYATYPAPKR